jgi:hypothetical protein
LLFVAEKTTSPCRFKCAPCADIQTVKMTVEKYRSSIIGGKQKKSNRKHSIGDHKVLQVVTYLLLVVVLFGALKQLSAPLLGRAVVCGEIPQFGGHGAFPAAAPCHSDGDFAWLFSPKVAITTTLMFQANCGT